MNEEIEKSREYKRVKKSLITQLKKRGNTDTHFMSLVDDYMDMFVAKEMAVKDIEERGLIIKCLSASGVPTTKKNESADFLIKLNAQMIKLLDKLDIHPNSEVASDDEYL